MTASPRTDFLDSIRRNEPTDSDSLTIKLLAQLDTARARIKALEQTVQAQSSAWLARSWEIKCERTGCQQFIAGSGKQPSEEQGVAICEARGGKVLIGTSGARWWCEECAVKDTKGMP